MILHITSARDWDMALSSGKYTAPSLQTEGFIHCSTVKQAVDTANIFFKGQKGLVLLCINEDKLTSECKYEAPTGSGKHDPSVGNLFPHVYGPINISAVIKVIDFPVGADGRFNLPAEILELR
ncbi:MAG TPA: DUF952 domain-containing protein [Bacteroidales bacterium]|nr:DUF952 domain-containing protein [Bacteroidales bacterium]